MKPDYVKYSVVALMISGLAACTTTADIDRNQYIPRVGGDTTIIADTSLDELQQLQLVSTNLVSALIQIPEMEIGAATIQVSNPKNAFGNTLLRALEDAGFNIQRVSADQGLNYLSYRKRFAETEAGPITDYTVSVGNIVLKREYNVSGTSVFPSSLLEISGTRKYVELELDDSIFTEQGGDGDSFISGFRNDTPNAPSPNVTTVIVNDYDLTPTDKRLSQETVLYRAKQRLHTKQSTDYRVDVDAYAKLRRTVLIFDDQKSIVMGPANKEVIKILSSKYQLGDIYAITACSDADGENDASETRGFRVEEEFIGHKISGDAVQIEPCTRASFRHSSDDSPVAVSIVQYRR